MSTKKHMNDHLEFKLFRPLERVTFLSVKAKAIILSIGCVMAVVNLSAGSAMAAVTSCF